MERRSVRVMAVLLTGHSLAAAWTWRDIQQQPAQQVRGSKTFWRAFSVVNTLGSAGYWLIGRRYRRPGHGRRSGRARQRRAVPARG